MDVWSIMQMLWNTNSSQQCNRDTLCSRLWSKLDGMSWTIWKETFLCSWLDKQSSEGSDSHSTNHTICPLQSLCACRALTPPAPSPSHPPSHDIFRLANTPWPSQMSSCRPRCLFPPIAARPAAWCNQWNCVRVQSAPPLPPPHHQETTQSCMYSRCWAAHNANGH